MELIIFLLLAVIGILVICMIVQQNAFVYKVEKKVNECQEAQIRAAKYSNKLTDIKSELNNIDYENVSYYELWDKFKRLKKVTEDEDTSTITKDLFKKI